MERKQDYDGQMITRAELHAKYGKTHSTTQIEEYWHKGMGDQHEHAE